MKQSKSATILILGFAIVFSISSLNAGSSTIDDRITKIIDQKGYVAVAILTRVIDPKLTPEEKKSQEELDAANFEANFYKQKAHELKEKFRIIERRKLKKVLDEIRFSSSGLVENDSLDKGKLLGADVLLILNRFPDRISVKAVMVNTGEIVEAASFSAPQKRLITDQMIKVAAHSYAQIPLNELKRGAEIEIEFKSNMDINAWLLDEENFAKFKSRQGYNYLTAASGKRTYGATYKLRISDEGNYYFILDNTFSRITPKKVAVKISCTDQEGK